MTVTATPTINVLCEPTSAAWLEQALGNIDTLLLDYSHCERKAASTAVNMMFRYLSNHKLVRQLAAIDLILFCVLSIEFCTIRSI